MYAIIETGSKQYKVSQGDIIDVELVDAKHSLTFDKVLLISDDDKTEVGTPYVKGAKVSAKVLEADIKDKKVTTFRYKNKINYHRTIGHRQRYTRVEIQEVKHGS
ncbi:MAG: 50S ribosomal protein L21 [Candidatus Margulisbacteria bacterium]|nr:50S ribosomal protein L21 [Candidatus Margulisiibacteriota bacterium]